MFQASVLFLCYIWSHADKSGSLIPQYLQKSSVKSLGQVLSATVSLPTVERQVAWGNWPSDDSTGLGFTEGPWGCGPKAQQKFSIKGQIVNTSGSAPLIQLWSHVLCFHFDFSIKPKTYKRA